MKMHSIKSKPTNYIAFAFCILLQSLNLQGQSFDLLDPKSVNREFKPAFQAGDGKLVHGDSGFQYTTEEPTEKDYDYRFVVPARLKAGKDFEIIADLTNGSIAESSSEVASIGIEVYQKNNLSNRLASELSVARLQGYFSRTIFSQIVASGEKMFDCFSSDLRVPERSKIKLKYNSKLKVFSIHYLDFDKINWVSVGSFGIAGDGGASGNAHWKMRSSETFLLYVYGFSKNMKIYDGDIQLHSLEINHNL